MSPKKETRKPGVPIIPQSPQFKVVGAVFAVLAGPIAIVTGHKGKKRKS